MYNAIYNIPFTNVDGESLNVQILEDGGSGSPVELTGGTPPFIVDYNNEDFLYTPARFSGATLKIVGGDYLQRLFSTDYQKFKVNLTKNGSVIWTGFITPEVYSQDFDNSLFELEIECISALSTLEYIEFEHDKESISFLDLIKKCITSSKGDFKGVYIPLTYNESLDDITISTSNFFDEKDKAMTLKECLEEVCKFLNWTVFEYEGSVYFIDVDYIKKGNASYKNIYTDNTTNLNSTIEINSIPSKGVSNTLSILGGYNEVTVIDSDYELDPEDIYPEISLDRRIDSEDITAGADGKEVDKNESIYKLVWYSSDNFKTYNYRHLGIWDEAIIFDKENAGTYILNFTSYKVESKPISLNWQEMFEIKMKYNGILIDNSTEFAYDKYRPHPDVAKILNNNIQD